MAACSPSYVIQLRLLPTVDDLIILNHRFHAAHHMHNIMVSHAIGCLDQLRRDKDYTTLLNAYTKDKKDKDIKYALSVIRMDHGLSEYQFHDYIRIQQYMYKMHIDSLTAQKIATSVWRGVEAVLFGKGKAIHYCKWKDFKSMEGKNNATGIRFQNGIMNFNGLKIKTTFKRNDEYIVSALRDRVKYCRLLRQRHKGKWRYYLQLIMEGIPPLKHTYGNNDGTVGIDIGPSSIAIVSNNGCELKALSDGIERDERQIRILQRKADRQRRANNPQNYKEDGTVKKGKKTWNKSNSLKKTEAKLHDLQRIRASKLKTSHNMTANRIIEKHGTNIIVEDMNFKALQKRSTKNEKNNKGRYKKKKRFGKSIGSHAPAMLITTIDRKLHYVGKHIIKVDTFQTAASQYDFTTNSRVKHKLKERMITINGYQIQRDLMAAFNIQHIVVTKIKKEVFYDYAVSEMHKDFDLFLSNHNNCINELKQLKNEGKRFPSCMNI